MHREKKNFERYMCAHVNLQINVRWGERDHTHVSRYFSKFIKNHSVISF